MAHHTTRSTTHLLKNFLHSCKAGREAQFRGFSPLPHPFPPLTTLALTLTWEGGQCHCRRRSLGSYLQCVPPFTALLQLFLLPSPPAPIQEQVGSNLCFSLQNPSIFSLLTLFAGLPLGSANAPWWFLFLRASTQTNVVSSWQNPRGGVCWIFFSVMSSPSYYIGWFPCRQRLCPFFPEFLDVLLFFLEFQRQYLFRKKKRLPFPPVFFTS
jgi:hypothetical protein